MITVSCPKCNKHYTFDESQIPPDLEVLQCKLCKTYFFLAPDDDDSPFENHLLFEPLEEIRTHEEDTIARLDFSTDQLPWEDEEDDEILELTELVQIKEENPMPQPILTSSILPFESGGNDSDPVQNFDEEVRIEEENKSHQPGFSAERFRYLNAKRRSSRRRILLYSSVALMSMFVLYYIFFVGP